MKYIPQDEVRPDIAEKSRKDIDKVNAYIDSVHGTVISVDRLRSGQPRPYADSVTEALIFLHQPSVLTTNGPMLRDITEEEARVLARLFVGSWIDNPSHGLETRLDFIRPEKNPCGLDESYINCGSGPRRSACWRVQITSPYCD